LWPQVVADSALSGCGGAIGIARKSESSAFVIRDVSGFRVP
jgi:hypothetical protein